MLFGKFFASSLSLFAAVSAITISENTVDRGFLDLGIGGVTVEDGVYWSIVDNAISAFVGDIDVGTGSGLYISSTSSLIALTVTLLNIGSVTNNGIISFNALKSLTPPIYNIIGVSFTNNGEMYLGSDGSVGIPLVSITTPVWNNNGLLVFYQNTRSTGPVSLGTPLGTINNNGQICLYNELYTQTTNIVGTGCITASQDSSIFLSNTALNIDSNQVFYLQDSASSIRATAISLPKTYNVAGFGNGNKIGLDVPLVTIPPLLQGYEYDTSTGILTLHGGGLGLLSQKFNIGLGYDPDLFSTVTDDDLGLVSVLFGAVSYSGPVPNPGLPSPCISCKPLPPPPGVSPTESTTTIVSTNSDGQVCTELDDILISTDASGSWFTTTSSITQECATNEQTTITSTWTGTVTTTITETDTPGGTDTVVVEVPSTPNSQTTITSTWTGTTTQTITETDTVGGTDTVIVEVPSTPNSQTTITSTWTGTTTQTITETDTVGGTDTVIVEVPSTPNSQTTITSTWTGTTTLTITETDTVGGTDTVIVEVPSTANDQTTITSTWTGTTT
ncbi:Hyphally regulated cell wall protein N-terminal-domain-containing protein, partial [Scheffersomyces xylosifermentans]|uniref:Hyphally regulated cell wall protein N-terminal-domain-containing protein n=1 Tax=Scheffersomyces xylosifermentans TaxID=1304137 RepID=UPI00315D3488